MNGRSDPFEISKEIRSKLIAKGASIVGFADLVSLPEQVRHGYRYGISVGVTLKPETIHGLKTGPDLHYYYEYNRINTLLNELDEYAAVILKGKGYEALPKTQSVVIEDKNTRRTELPHKTVATRAGLGWIGKCALLVTEEYGSAIRISSVLTNAKLEVGKPTEHTGCGNCSECKDACPAGAVSGNQWTLQKDRDEFYDAISCNKTARERSGKAGIDMSLCGLCIYVCPWTQRYLKKVEEEAKLKHSLKLLQEEGLIN